MPARTLSSDSMTLHSMTQYDQMDPEIRLQIQSNIHVLYEPSVAPLMHIATCRRVQDKEITYLSILVKQDHLAKALSNPATLASEPRTTRSAAMLSLLEATEQRISEMLVQTKGTRENGKKHPASPTPEPKIIRMPTDTSTVSLDYGEKPKEKGFIPWRKHNRVESAHTRNVCD